jgi:hypothetical protein
MAITNVKALTFDVFGTVVDWRSSIIREGETLGRAKGLSVPRPAEHGPGRTKDVTPAREWDVVARDFVDLAARLGC